MQPFECADALHLYFAGVQRSRDAVLAATMHLVQGPDALNNSKAGFEVGLLGWAGLQGLSFAAVPPAVKVNRLGPYLNGFLLGWHLVLGSLVAAEAAAAGALGLAAGDCAQQHSVYSWT